MANTHSDSLPRLADALSEVGDRLWEISNELRDLQVKPAAPKPAVAPKSALASEPAPRLTVPPPARVSQPPAPVSEPVSQPAIPEPVMQVATKQPADEQVPWYPPPVPFTEPAAGPTLWERASRDGAGSKILAWAGGVVTLAGVVLLLVLAIQNGYLGPLPRVLLGAGLGLALIGIGMRLHTNPNARTGAYALAATGIAVLYLDVVAATTLHEYLPPYAGLLTGLAVAGLGIALAGRWNSQLLAVFVVVCCTVCAPILTGGFTALLLGFLLVIKIATTPVQLAKRWGWLCFAAGLPPLLASLVGIALTKENQYDATATTAVLCMITSAIIITLATITAARRPGDEFALALVLIAPAPTMLAALLLPRAGGAALPAVLSMLLIGVWALDRGHVVALSQRFALSAGGAGVLAALQATATALDGNARPIAILGEALLLTLLAVRLRQPVALLPASLFGVVGLLLSLIVAVPPTMVTEAPIRDLQHGTIVTAGVTGLLIAAVAIAMCRAVISFELLPAEDQVPHGWTTAGVIALYGASATMLSVGLLISPDRNGFLIGHVLVTVSWTVGALILLLRGIDSVPMRVAGLALVAAALAKLVLFDLSSLDGIARVAAFLVAGLVLLAAGARYAKLVATRART